MIRPFLICALLLSVAPARSMAQAPARSPVLRQPSEQTEALTAPTPNVDARLVNIPVVVYDKKGGLVQSLTKDNFVLQVDGHPQTILSFALNTDLPLTLGLVVDVGPSQREVLSEERTASSAFLDDMLNEDRNKAFIVQFARQTDLLQDVTNSKSKLQAGLKQIEAPAFSSEPRDVSVGSNSGDKDSNDSSGRPRRAGTTLYDALFLSSDELMSKQTGRKAIIILADGVDNGSKESLTSALEAAQRADAIVFAIYFKGTETGFQDRNQTASYPGSRGGGYPGGGYPGGGYPGGGYPGGGGGYPGGRGGQQTPVSHIDGKRVLQQMADETGGRLFEVSKKQTVADIYKMIGDELRAEFRLSYTPDDKAASDGYHKVDLDFTKTTSKDLYIQTRDGYYSGKQ